jgi:pyruvate formate lyase activating enzyme
MDKKALISDIKRFAVHDGDGVRTTVFFKGCPLKCVWCHNPEGISFKSEVAYYSHKCIGCMECVEVCPTGAHKASDKGHIFDRNLCIGCSKCAENCLGNALQFYGKEVTVEELLPKLLEDKDFYQTGGGGVTLSGGECLSRWEFCLDLLKRLKENDINTAVDTCGLVPREVLSKIAEYTDTFLYDIKAIDRDVHKKCTGQYNDVILENIKYLDSINAKIEVRYPFVPDLNSGEAEKIADFLKDFNNLTKVRVLPYHNYAASKYASLDMENTLPDTLPSDPQLEKAKEYFKARKIEVV